MRKLFKITAAAIAAAAVATGAQAIAASASTAYFDDNYGAYIVASGSTSGGDCLTSYYTEVGDGNAVLTFDLLKTNDNGWFGLLGGSASSVKAGKIADMEDYVLTGKSMKTSLSASDFAFESGYTYRATYSSKDKKVTLARRDIGSDGEFGEVFSASVTASKTSAIGIAAYSDGYASSAVAIDNLSVTDLKGRSYVDNDFDGASKVGDGNMQTVITDPETGSKLNTGKIFIHKDETYKVVFMAENGERISEQKVCLYGTASAPTAPVKEGYEFDGWSRSLVGVTGDMVVYANYRLSEEKPDDPGESAGSGEESASQGGEASAESASGSSGEKKSGGCGGSAASPAWLALALIPAFAFKRRAVK